MFDLCQSFVTVAFAKKFALIPTGLTL